MLNLSRDAVRVTRAMTTRRGAAREFVLVESRGDVSPVIRSIEGTRHSRDARSAACPFGCGSDFALARVGPRTLAVGAAEVEELVRVRLGIKPDLKTPASSSIASRP